MIINLKKQINNVANNMTSIYDGINLLYIDKISGYFNKLNFEYEIEKIEKSKYNWFFICKDIVYMDSDKFYDLKSNEFIYHYNLKEVDEFLQPISCFGKTILLSLINEKTEKVRYVLFFIDEFKIHQLENQTPLVKVFNTKLISIINSSLIVLENDNQIWQQSFSSLIQSQEPEEIFISQEIIEISNIIYFTLNTNNQNICFGLDAETGKVLKQFPNILGDLIQENEYIYFLYYNSITRLNTTNDAIEKWEIQELLDKEDIGYLYFPRWAVLEGQIYFSQTKGSDIHSGQQGAKFGILDFSKKELIYKSQLSPEYGTIGSIKVSKERLYLHTQDSTLHVFEKS